MSLEQTTYTGINTEDNEATSSQSEMQTSVESSDMAFPKSAYVGLAIDELDLVDTDAGSVHTGRSRVSRRSGFSRFSQTSQTSYRSNFAVLTTQARAQASQAASHVAHNARQLLTLQYWRTASARTKTFSKEVWADAKTMRIGHFLWRFTNIVGPIGVIVTLSILLRLASSKDLYQINDACRPDSGFYVGDQAYDLWALNGFFQITLGFGSFDFSQAKIIDVSFDIVIGRGGQGLLVWICLVVYSKALVRSMEMTSVSFGTYEAVTLQCGSITGTLKLARDLLKHPTMQAKLMVFWIITSAIFVLAFPTMVSAMSGYAANINSYVLVDDGTMVPYSKFSLVRYVIHDGDRLGDGFKKDHKIQVGRYSESYEVAYFKSNDLCISSYYPRNDSDTLEVDWNPAASTPDCELYWHVSEYAFKYGFQASSETNSTFNNSGTIIDLPSPSLDISAIFWNEDWIDGEEDALWSFYPYGFYWQSPTGDYPFQNNTVPLLTNGDYAYDANQINERGQCQQLNTSYKWGFSFLILFVVLLLFILWCTGMFILWLDAFLNSRVDNAGRHLGLQRAVLDLANAMRNDLGEDMPEMASNNQLNKKVRKELKGGRITYKMLNPEYLPPSRWAQLHVQWRIPRSQKGSFCTWAKDDIGWVIFFVICLGFVGAALGGSHAPVFTALLLTYGTGSALHLGPKRKGRWLVFLIFAIIAVALAPVGPYVYQDRDHYSIIWLQQDAYDVLYWWYNH